MQMPGILILYATTHGHTTKIASRIADAVRAQGQKVDVVDARDPGETTPVYYYGIIVGASLHAAHHQREVIDWVKSNRDSLRRRPSLFFSVSLTAAEDTEEARE